MLCIDGTIQNLLLDLVSNSIFTAAMIKLVRLYKYAGFLV